MATDLVPRTRTPSVTPSYRTQSGAAAVHQFEAAAGGREPLITALQHAPASDDLAYVIGLISDPANDARDLARICADGHITIGELMEAYKRGVIAAAQVAAIHQVAAHLPAVAEDVMTRARPHYVVCDICHGDRSVPSGNADRPPDPCRRCKATGQIVEAGDLDRQKLALEMGGLGPKRAPVVDLSDRRKVSFGDNSAAGLANLIGAVDQLLHGRGGPPRGPQRQAEPAVDGEIVQVGAQPGSLESTIDAATDALDADPDPVAEPEPEYRDDVVAEPEAEP